MSKYIVNNDTDGIPAASRPFDTRAEAEDFIRRFRQKFKDGQGYYKTSSFERINPDDILLSIEVMAPFGDTYGDESDQGNYNHLGQI